MARGLPTGSQSSKRLNWRGGSPSGWSRLAWVWLFIACQMPGVRADLPGARDQYAVLITIDGFPAAMFRDPKTPIPTIRRLAAVGVVAEAMRVANPTVTWPNHTTLLTGARPDRHSVLYNGILARGSPDLPVSVDPKKDKSELVAIPTLFDVLHRAGLRTAAIDWPCTRNSPSLDDDFPDSPDPLLHATPRLRRELVEAHILPGDSDAAFAALTGAGRDEIWTQAACHVIRTRQPHLLALHLLNTDGIHHRYGPGSAASYTALALADSYVGQVLQALDSAGIRAKTTLFVTADHGFGTATNILQPNVLLRQAGLLETGRTNQIVRARVQVVPEGGTGMVYLNNPSTAKADRQTVLDLFTGQEGIAQMLEPSQFARLGLPEPSKNRGMADLVLVAKTNYGIAGSAVGDDFVVRAGSQSNLGYHGYLSTDPDMEAPFVASGRGIKRGIKIGPIENIDIAPTIGLLLGTSLPDAEGKPLLQILTSENEPGKQ